MDEINIEEADPLILEPTIPDRSLWLRIWDRLSDAWGSFSNMIRANLFNLQAWRYTMGAMSFIAVLLFPFDLAFSTDIPLTFVIAMYATTSIFWIDIWVTWMFWWDVSSKRMFCLDVVSSLPLYEVCPRNYRAFACIIRLLRFPHILVMFARLEGVSKKLFGYMRLVLAGLSTAHVCGCFYLYLAAYNPQHTWIGLSYLGPRWVEASIWDRYTTSVYFSMTTLTTVGYGDMHPDNVVEGRWTIFFLLLKIGVGAYLTDGIIRLVYLNDVASHNDEQLASGVQLSVVGTDTVDETDNDGRTALHHAAIKGNKGIVIELLAMGANKDAEDSKGYTPIIYALQEYNFETAYVLLGKGANINAGRIGDFICSIASMNNLSLLKQIEIWGGDLNIKNSKGQNALNIAMEKGLVDICTFLENKLIHD